MGTNPGHVRTCSHHTADVNVLDWVAALRNSRTDVVDIGPRNHPVAAFVTNVSDSEAFDGAPVS